MERCSVLFFPDNVAAQVPPGTTLLRAAALAGLELKSGCGGKGTCGRCIVQVKQGRVRVADTGNLPKRKVREGYVLACCTYVEGNTVVEVPGDSRLIEHQVLVDSKEVLPETAPDVQLGDRLGPLCRQLQLQLDEPTLVENASDLSRLEARLRKEVPGKELSISLGTLQKLAQALREENWKVTVTLAEFDGRAEIVAVRPGHGQRQALGLAVDIGTTTVVVYLIDLATGVTMDMRGTYNKQSRYGDDVITRMVYATEEESGLADLHEAVLETINELVAKLVARNGVDPADILQVVVAGNTTMSHLFLGLHPRYIRLEPYIPTASQFPPVRAREVGLAINPEAWVLTFPAVASYVGGDIVAGTLYAGLTESDEVGLLIDIGTNGEMVLGNREWQVACSCSAGPAFEGGGITFGMRAMKGAIERVEVDPDTLEVSLSTVQNARPIGICGSGLIDCLATLRNAGIIDRAGKFQTDLNTPRLRHGETGPEFVLAWGRETECGRDIIITEPDVKNLLRAKGAVFAGIRTLLKAVDFDLDGVSRIYIAGGFGNYLNVRDSINIGLLPDVPAEKYAFIGNSSVKGARMALLSADTWRTAFEVARSMTYLELSADNVFMEEFFSGLFLPHTDLSLFPSVRK
ncbi:MAG: ASKHA domain-containing protein [Bacillota bacterium]